MSLNLLIDTCAWIELVSKIEVSEDLKQLQLWVNTDQVLLYSPPKLVEEWEKHSISQLEKIKQAVKKHANDLKKARLFNRDILEFEMELAERLLSSQIKTINDLFKKSKSVPETDHAIVLSYKHKKENKAPFHNKLDSENDALIIFSTLDYLVEYSEDELYFISNNHSDYASPLDLKTSIHPDIAREYKSVNIKYFNNLKTAFKFFRTLGLPSLQEKDQLNKYRVRNNIIVNKSAHIIDQLYEYLEKRFDGILFIPKMLFAEHYPFLLKDTFLLNRKPFTIVTDNKDVFQVLQNAKVVNGVLQQLVPQVYKGVIDVDTKIKRILQILVRNQIQAVSLGEKQRIELEYSDGYDCKCCLCTFGVLQFHEVFQKLTIPPKDIYEELKIAYTFYKVGSFKASALLLKAIATNASKNNKPFLYYIARFNLVKLIPFLENQYYDQSDHLALIEELKKIDLNDDFDVSENSANQQIIEWIHDSNFMKQIAKLHQLVGEIRISFFNQNSGWNENTLNLISAYREVENFLNQNFIIYDQFLEFHEMSELFIEGLFASYGCNINLGGKLQYFSDSLLNTIIFYGNAEKIRHYFSRYKINELLYASNTTERSFVKRFEDLLDNYLLTAEEEKKVPDIDSYFFWRKYSEIFINCLTLAALLNLESKDLNVLTKKLVSFLNVNTNLDRRDLIKTINIFLKRKQHILAEPILNDFFVFGLFNETFSNVLFLETMAEIFQSKKITLNLDYSTYKQFLEKFFLAEDVIKGSLNIEAIGYIFSSINNLDQRSGISSIIESQLLYKFDSNTFYHAYMVGAIAPDEQLSFNYIQEIKKRLSKGKNASFLSDRRSYYADFRLDEFINYWFKNDFELDLQMRESFSALGNYYKWIIDLDGYDYIEFDPSWLWNHFTIYYKLRFKRSVILKDQILSRIKPPADPKLTNIFIDIYVRNELDGH